MHLSPTSKLGYLSFKDPTTLSTEVVWPTKRDSEPVTVCVSHTPFI